MGSGESYEPSWRVKWLHMRPRFTFSLEAASNEFPNSFESKDEYHNWFEGCQAWAGVLSMVGLILGAVLTVGYLGAAFGSRSICSAKSKDRKKLNQLYTSLEREDFSETSSSSRDRSSTVSSLPGASSSKQRECAYNRRLYAVTMILLFAFLVLSISTFIPVTAVFDDGINRGLDGIESAQGILRRLVDIAQQVVGQLEQIEEQSRELADEAERARADDAAQNLRNFADATEDPQASASQAISSAKDLDQRLNTIVEGGRSASDKYAFRIAYSYVAIMCTTNLIFLGTLTPRKGFALPYKGFGVPLNILFFVSLWVATGLYLMFGLMAADYCIEPNRNTIELFQSHAGPKSSSAQTVTYYLSCQPGTTEDISDDDGLRYQVRAAEERTEFLARRFQETFEDLKQNTEGHGHGQRVVEEFKQLNSTVQDTVQASRELDNLASCHNIRTTWYILLDAVCGSFISDGIITLFCIQNVMLTFLTFILLFGWSFCVRHPSRKFDMDVTREFHADDNLKCITLENIHAVHEDERQDPTVGPKAKEASEDLRIVVSSDFPGGENNPDESTPLGAQ
eukprot:gb/GECG01001238.1/.p1 GENE.gb/GECG01001238.1/~~gb/GECG01001238.1/.p1  ORF type:complete len:568 (+),score=57.04 gb/GECG01001238.1/:1-1704(+)